MSYSRRISLFACLAGDVWLPFWGGWVLLVGWVPLIETMILAIFLSVLFWLGFSLLASWLFFGCGVGFVFQWRV